MNIVNVRVDEIKAYGKNPRKNEKAVPFVMNSIKEFGFKVPIILDRNNVIVAGHTRLKAARRLGMKEVPCIIADDLTDEQVKAFRLADNKVGERAEWDDGLLQEELTGILDIDMSKFDFAVKGDEEDEEEPEVPFTEVLDEESNYVVLVFHNEVDWLNAQTVLGIKPVKALSTNQYKDNSGTMRRIGIGRVLDGVEALKRAKGE